MCSAWSLPAVPALAPLTLLALLALVPAAPCQNTIVSPVVATNTEGAGNNVYPWANSTVRRYQQIHGDIGGSAKVIRKLSFRLEATTINYTGTRAIDLELFVGLAKPVSQTSFVFARNYVGAPVPAIARKVINMGPQGQGVIPGPNPFTSNMDVVLDTPFPYPGTTPFIWEAVVYSNTIAGAFGAMDAEAGSFASGTSVTTGAGCGPTQSVISTDCAGILLLNFQLTGGPANAATLLAVGSSNPNLAVPGLCSNLFTNLTLILPLGVTDGTGAITSAMTGNSTFVLPNTLAGATLYTQMHSLNAAQPGIPVANSNGKSAVMPVANLTKVVNVARIFNDVGGTNATEGQFFSNLTIGYGLVTQFTY